MFVLSKEDTKINEDKTKLDHVKTSSIDRVSIDEDEKKELAHRFYKILNTELSQQKPAKASFD